MRSLDQEEQEQRKRKVLQFVVHEYIRTGKPVGSAAIASHGHFGLSPATIRNILADLEREEIITHPHTSAGRTPTDKGYRVYVDSLIELQRLAIREQSRIQQEYEMRCRQIEDLLSQTSRMLSSISHYTGFIMAPKMDSNIFARLELVPVGEKRVLVAMISESGITKHFVVATDVEIPRERLSRISNLVTAKFKGSTLQSVQLNILEGLEDAEQEYQEIMGLAGEISRQIKHLSVSEVYMDGASNILSLPDFARSEDMSGIFKIMEEKQILANLLESEMKACADCGAILDEEDPTIKKSGSKESRMMLHHKGQGRVHVCIGSENPIKSLHNLSVVSSTYQLSDKTVGVLGILGPKRMEYSKMIALVDYMSQMMNRLLRDLNEK